ncbi:MAG TPA: carboxypeptidase-like regulatory domain-containing protein [Gemmatimonadaceae bacterium]|nr:carboxypeptidase-like regulatory domain-containing protein [Gemmatimonadaceae bacterium]
MIMHRRVPRWAGNGAIVSRLIARLAIALLAIARAPQIAHAQHDTTATLLGTLKDSTGRPISGAEVYVLTIGRGARTSDDGRYAIIHVLQGPAHVRARLPGWQPVDTAIVVAPGSTVTLNLILTRRIDALDTVRVTSQDSCEPRGFNGFECRRKAGIGAFRDSTEIAAINAVYLADLFDGIRGVKRVPVRLGVSIRATTGQRCITMLVNGRRPFAAEMRNIMYDAIALEFYDDEDKIPEWYKVLNQGHCSLVVFWLKGAPQTADEKKKKPD